MSKQDHETPNSFIQAVENTFGKISFDLAASFYNKKHDRYYAKEGTADPMAEAFDALKQDWVALSRTVEPNSIMLLNPEFKQIAPWAKKCEETAPYLFDRVKIGLLVPASVGSNWFAQHVFGKSFTNFLNGRLDFIEGEMFKKDCIFSLYGYDVNEFGPDLMTGCDVWRWRDSI